MHKIACFLCDLHAHFAWLLLMRIRKLTLHSRKYRKVIDPSFLKIMTNSFKLLERVLTSWKIRDTNAVFQVTQRYH